MHLIDRVRFLQPRTVIPFVGHLPVRISAGEDEGQRSRLEHLADGKYALAANVNIHQRSVKPAAVDQLASRSHSRRRSYDFASEVLEKFRGERADDGRIL